MKSILRSILWGVALIAFQTTVVRLISIEGVMPDVVVLWIVVIALREGQIAGTVSGFVSGLILDIISGDFLGIGALSKTICGFLSGYFYDEFKSSEVVGTYRFFFAVIFSSLVHNIVFFVVYLQGSEIEFVRTIIQYGIGTTAYTSAIGIIPLLWKRK
ncbi:MAG: rod shape-determining protein MreD [Ignavibacteria bacterium]|nr:rod shape-determining protein MreD [Ignavibacteria bacterium]